MHVEVEAKLRELAEHCPTIFLNEKEWGRLYGVALSLHMHGGLQDHKVVQRFLLDHSCGLYKAWFLSRQVQHLCTALQVYDDHPNTLTKGSASRKGMMMLWIGLVIVACLAGILYLAATEPGT